VQCSSAPRYPGAADNRLFVEAVLYRYRIGIPWRDLPARFGDWKVVHRRFGRWAKNGGFERIFKLLASDHDNEYMMIDATIVRAHLHSAGAQKNGRARLCDSGRRNSVLYGIDTVKSGTNRRTYVSCRG